MKDDDVLRLFGVKNVRTGAIAEEDGEPVYFSYKDEAKELRGELAEKNDEAYAVILGPDHWKNKTVASPSGVAADLGM